MNDEPLILEWEFIGIDEGMRQMQQLIKEAKAMQQQMDACNASGMRLNKTLADMPSSSGGSSRSAGISMPSMSHLPSIGGAGGGGGSGGALIGNLGQMIGGDLVPAIGEAATMLGEFATGPLVVASAGVKLMADAAKAAAASLTEFRQSMLTSGGTAGETNLLRTVGGAAGISDPAGLSRTLSDALKTSEGAAAGSRIGIHDFGGNLSGPIDKAQNLLKAIDTIGDRNKTSDEEALRLARALHVEQVLIYRDVSNTTKAMAAQAAISAGMVNDKQSTDASAELNAQLSIAGTNFKSITDALGVGFMPVMTDLVKLFNLASPALIATAKGMGMLFEALEKSSLLHGLVKILEKMEGIDGDGVNAAQKEHTEAMRDHAKALRAGTYGGGPNARNALPASWGGQNSKQWDAQARGMGSML